MTRYWGDEEDNRQWHREQMDKRPNPRRGEESGYLLGALLVLAFLVGLMWLGAWLTSLV